MQKHRSWQGASESEWQEACRRESAIRSLIESGPVSHARADVVAKDLGISRALVYRLASISASGANLLAFAIPSGSSTAESIIDPEVEALICTVAHEEFRWAVETLVQGRMDVGPILSGEFPLADAISAFEFASDRSNATKVSLVARGYRLVVNWISYAK